MLATMTSTLAFHGAAGTVTGSRFLLTSGQARILVDCGQFQGPKELRELNWRKPPFDPRSLDAVVLTHAHIDHSGMLPRLMVQGFRGPIYATPGTCELAEILLLDAAKIQEEDAEYANRKGFSRHRPALPLFTEEDTRATLRHFKALDYGDRLDLRGVDVTLHNAGHILGSAHVEIRLHDPAPHTIVFSGDLGRYGVPLHKDPDPLPRCDTLVLESTYGDRHHAEEALEDQLEAAMRDTLRHGGTVLIPAFAVARAQLLTLLIGRMMKAGRLQRVPVDIDSPMATDVTDTYRRFADDENLDEDIRGGTPLVPPTVRFHRSVQESRALNSASGPRIIISASGMLTGGRVLHHLARLAPHTENLILLAGYQSVGTRGRDLVEGRRQLKVHGQWIDIRCRVEQLEGFSAHADQAELLKWVGSSGHRPATVFLVHGETDSARTFEPLVEKAGTSAIVPLLDSRYELTATGRWRSAG